MSGRLPKPGCTPPSASDGWRLAAIIATMSIAAAAAPENDTFLRACLRQPTPHTPVWLMRQAGRYLPEYKATRTRAGDSFMALATNPALATEVTLQPLERFPLDAAILFSDILTVPDAMGLGLSFGAGEGPRFARPLRSEADVAALAVPDLNRLRYVFDAVTSIRRALHNRVPLIGFAGSPWTLACYMVEGAGSADYRLVKTMLYARPDLLHRILDINAQAVTAYLNAQIDAGAQAVMLFDSWGGVLADGAFQHFSLEYTRRVVAGLQREKAGQRVPCIVFTKGGAGPGSMPLPTAGPMSSGSTGQRTWRQPGTGSAAAWRCRATSTRQCCSLRPKWWRAKPAPSWTASAIRSATTAAAMVTSSTWVMASASTPIPGKWWPWSKPSMPTHAACGPTMRRPRRP